MTISRLAFSGSSRPATPDSPDSTDKTRPTSGLSRLRQKIWHQKIRQMLSPEAAYQPLPEQALPEDVFEAGSFKKDIQSKSGPELASLFEIAVMKKDQAAFDSLLETAEETQQAIPKKTLEFAAACGETDQLKRMFPLSKQLTEEDQNKLLDLAERQQKVIADIRKVPVGRWHALQSICNTKKDTPEKEAESTLEAIAYIQAGAKVDKADPVGHTPLHLASNYGHEGIVHALIQAGANVNAAGRYKYGGGTPLQFASSQGHEGVVRALIDAGANVDDANNKEGKTSLQYASDAGHEGVVQLLKAHGATE